MYLAGQLGAYLTEVWRHYDCFNERVIPRFQNVAPRRSPGVFLGIRGVFLPLTKPLPPQPSGAIMKRR
jgi:hypothetical protein